MANQAVPSVATEAVTVLLNAVSPSRPSRASCPLTLDDGGPRPRIVTTPTFGLLLLISAGSLADKPVSSVYRR
jgi:hypothetical protein